MEAPQFSCNKDGMLMGAAVAYLEYTVWAQRVVGSNLREVDGGGGKGDQP